MNILVCIKQVPGTTKVEVDEKTGVLKRDGVESKMNPYDLYAVETGVRMKEKLGGTVTVVTMGPLQAEAIIKEAYMMGADKGYIFSDKKFAGADVLATSYTLSQGIRVIGDFDLILCGKQTTDGDTAQVGPAIAEYLAIPHVTWVKAIEEVDNEKIVVEQDMADSYEVVELHYPCLITVEKDIYQPRLPSYRRKLQTMNTPVTIIGFEDFADQDDSKYGLNGSPTQVEKIFPPVVDVEQVLWNGKAEHLASNMFDMLKEAKFV
ncbi:electron transfer flavoprotein subunit beta/FixA family protein [Petroclostridium sp. X23]|uniref:electron transfer flavoprotein subunit beta/FixA family protein n=1 Tax=Petroclostridium sp. X23 TaxID=3045146 RepID=UPI0024ADA821|nr:electron transfer flavoprotein subunit beta/FixA family protein [Petroclostridium sp. X23]WHH58019.1 electron transfer flavoprotein subunit beta/FixA family protein [Petroclostridium sp. X23]